MTRGGSARVNKKCVLWFRAALGNEIVRCRVWNTGRSSLRRTQLTSELVGFRIIQLIQQARYLHLVIEMEETMLVPRIVASIKRPASGKTRSYERYTQMKFM